MRHSQHYIPLPGIEHVESIRVRRTANAVSGGAVSELSLRAPVAVRRWRYSEGCALRYAHGWDEGVAGWVR